MPAHDARPTLYLFSGLPASGKSTLAQRLAAYCGAVYLRIDSIEQALRDLCAIRVEGEGYRLAYRVASDNLRIGRDVVADSCNPIALTRAEWEATAESAGARAVNIEIVCSDPVEHRRRVETRVSEIPGLVLPNWEQVVRREYHPWPKSPIEVDTAGRSVDVCFAQLRRDLGSQATAPAGRFPGEE